jgi:hypothetical protein
MSNLHCSEIVEERIRPVLSHLSLIFVRLPSGSSAWKPHLAAARWGFQAMQAQRQSKRSVLALLRGKCRRSDLALLALALLSIAVGSPAANVENPIVPSTGLEDANLAPGFKVERYAQVWQRNPFTLVTPTVPTVKESPFSKMFLTSWLKDGPQEVIYVQNSDTNDVQRITEQPNQNSLRLLEFHPNSDPKLVEAVVSDGKEKGVVKFRFDVQTAAAQSFSPEVQAHSGAPPGNSPSRPGLQTAPQPATASASPQSAPNGGSHVQRPPGQPSASQANAGASNSGSFSSSSRMQMSPRGRPGRVLGSEAVHLPAP